MRRNVGPEKVNFSKLLLPMVFFFPFLLLYECKSIVCASLIIYFACGLDICIELRSCICVFEERKFDSPGVPFKLAFFIGSRYLIMF